jgi:glycosyltransferase involved in cell wall biosynthesis
LARWFERRILSQATAIVTVSGYLKQAVIDSGVPAQRVAVTPNAVDAHHFDPEQHDGRSVRERYGLADATVVGFVGSFARWHRPDLLIQAFGALAGDYPHVRLLLVGSGAMLPSAKRLAQDLGVSHRIVFTDKIPHRDIPEYIAAMDVGVMPASNVFGSPVKVFEYMAMARPVVAPRYGPLEEVVDDGVNGFLFEPDSVAALAGSLRWLLDDPERCRCMGAVARQTVLVRHQWSHNARIVLGLLSDPQPMPASGLRHGDRPVTPCEVPDRGDRAA